MGLLAFCQAMLETFNLLYFKLGRPLRLAQAVELGTCPCTCLTDGITQ